MMRSQVWKAAHAGVYLSDTTPSRTILTNIALSPVKSDLQEQKNHLPMLGWVSKLRFTVLGLSFCSPRAEGVDGFLLCDQKGLVQAAPLGARNSCTLRTPQAGCSVKYESGHGASV